ncbi:MAG: hypothetical protein AAFY41_10870 [Bacteroidota bacterium]
MEWYILFEDYVLKNFNASDDFPEEENQAILMFHFLIKEELLSERKMKTYMINNYFKNSESEGSVPEGLVLEKLALMLDIEPSLISYYHSPTPLFN